VTLSVTDATERLRPVADARGRGRSGDPDRRAARRVGQWTQRHGNEAKLASGRATDLAEIVRDGEPFQHSARLSPAERGVYLQARGLLVRELCFARKVEEDEAEAWIGARSVPATEAGPEWLRRSHARRSRS
jgi:hypothetical protein